MSKPLVLVPCDVKAIPGSGPFHCVGEKYLDAVVHGADCMVLLLPALGHGHEMDSFENHYDLDALLDLAQGVFLPGSASNIDPSRYRGHESDMLLDKQRDTAVFALIERVLARRLPLLAVCRGLQELNVALGGTLHANVQDVPGLPVIHEAGDILHANVQDVPGLMDHREDKSAPRERQYEPAHPVKLTRGGVLASILGADQIEVNSLHAQGIASLGNGLNVEARAADGVVEAVSLPGQWALGVQWHPEWRYRENPASVRLFEAFGKAIRGV